MATAAATAEAAQDRRTWRGPVHALIPHLLTAIQTADLVVLASDEASALELTRALQGGAPDRLVVYCPASDALPGDGAPPSSANAGQRATALRRLRASQAAAGRNPIALVTTGEAAGRLYPPPHHFDAALPVLKQGQPIDLEALAAELIALGYIADDRVDEPGEMAVRGKVLDIFPADAGRPFRLEVQDGALASIREFDPASQLTEGECDRLEVGRASEPELGEGVALLAHLPGAQVLIVEGADRRRRQFLDLAADAARRMPARAPRDICTEAQWREAIARHPCVDLATPSGEPPPRFVEQRAPQRAFLRAARQELEGGGRVLLLGTPRDLRFILRRVSPALEVVPRPIGGWAEALEAEAGSVLMLEMPLQRGFRWPGLLAVAAADLLGSRAQREAGEPGAAGAEIFALSEIRTGDVVVHEEHGICVVAGLEALPQDGGDAIVLRFADEARRMIPVSEAHRIWRYGAEESAVSLDRLDGSSWAKRREKVAAAIAETAGALIALATERQSRSAPALAPDPSAYERFVAGFPFAETADQARAIEAVRADLAAGKPMDRLVVGDVGYGKTEIALRAAAIAALAGMQVALAAPTTVLARQHLETFRERFGNSGIEVAGLTRFTPAAEKRRILAGLRDGSIGIVVGTGAIAGKSVTFAQLGLVIVDEEQKFGAADKAKLRALGAGHLLTLSATPIPRTLQSALVGLQQLSIIATPPARRQPIRTTVGTFDPATIRLALLRERSRGGQSFIVVPRVEDIAGMADELARLVPELRVVTAHGKMQAAALDEAMVAFAGGEGDVLLATNIIESGLDVPRANTMIVARADRFGLSQLHQLRGRVGRGARRGQIYLFTDRDAAIAPRTLARLNTLQAFDRLGAGFAISARDLDLRGAGDLLSDEQTGHVKLMGVDLYQHLLEAALRTARGEAVDDWSPTLNFEIGGRLPPDWIPDENVRVGLAIRLARILDLPALDAFEEELFDRFGELPDEARQLLGLARVRTLAREAGIERIDAGAAAIALTPRAGVETSDHASLERANGRLLLREAIADPAARLQRVEALLAEMLGQGEAEE